MIRLLLLIPNSIRALALYLHIVGLRRKLKKYKKEGDIQYPLAQRYKKVTKICKAVLQLTNHKLVIVGEENIPNKTVLFTPNHRDNIDSVVMIAAFKKIKGKEKATTSPFFIAKKETEEKFFYGAMGLIDTLLLDRTNLRQAIQLFKVAADTVRANRSCVVFPEGTRNDTEYAVLPFKAGAFKIAYQAHAPVVPVTISGSEGGMKRSLIASRRTITVTFHKALLPQRFANIPTDRLAHQVEQVISDEYSQRVGIAETKKIFVEEEKKETQAMKSEIPAIASKGEEVNPQVETIKPRK